jgi:DNA-binding response OmpR family regulator
MSGYEPARVLLCEMEEHLAAQLQNLLVELGDEVTRNPHCLKSADLVFCGSNPRALPRLLRVLKRNGRAVPVIVVSHDADVPAWLDALEAGAADYLVTPFERAQVRWIRQTQLPSRPAKEPALHSPAV